MDLLDDQPALFPLSSLTQSTTQSSNPIENLRETLRNGKFRSGAEYAASLSKNTSLPRVERLAYLQATMYCYLKLKKYKAVSTEAAILGISYKEGGDALTKIRALCL